jgi:hypothetical protein
MLEQYFNDHVDEHISDINTSVRDTVSDGLVDVIGSRDDTPVFITIGSDDPVYDTGKTLSVIQETPSPRTVQYVTQTPDQLVVENLEDHVRGNVLECYGASKSHGAVRFTPFGNVEEPSSQNPVADYLLNEYASNDEEREIMRRILTVFDK